MLLVNLILCVLLGQTGVMLFDKWKVDDYMNLHGFWCKYWPARPCMLCRAFWFGALSFALIQLLPDSIYVLLPLAAIPLQRILGNLCTR